MASENVFDPDFAPSAEEVAERAPLEDPDYVSPEEEDADLRAAVFAATVREDGSTPRSTVTPDSDPKAVSETDSPKPGLDPSRPLSTSPFGPDPVNPNDPNFADHSHTAADAAQVAAEERPDSRTTTAGRTFPEGTTAAQVLELERQQAIEDAENAARPATVASTELGNSSGAGAEVAPTTLGVETPVVETDKPSEVPADAAPKVDEATEKDA